MKIDSKTKKILLLVMIPTIILVFVYVYILFDLNNKNQETASILNENEKAYVKNLNFQSTKKIINSSKESILNMSTFFITKDGVVNFINTIESIGKSVGLNISIASVDIKTDTNKSNNSQNNNKDELNLDIETEGTWTQTLKFIHLLEYLPFNINLNQVNIINLNMDNSKNNTSKSKTSSWHGSFAVSVTKFK